jgi:hypothetical protein
MRVRVLLAALIAGLLAAPGAGAAPPVLEHGHFVGSLPPAPPHAVAPGAPIKSFKVEVLS